MPKCDMKSDCLNPITHIDNKGFVYCTECGKDRKLTHSCRKLRPWELKLIQAGRQVPSYKPVSKRKGLEMLVGG